MQVIHNQQQYVHKTYEHMTVTVAMNSILIVNVKYFTIMMCHYHF